MKYKVTRALLLAGVRQEVGSEIDIDSRDLIGSLKTAGKIAPVDPDLEPPAGPMTAESTAALVGTRSAKKSKPSESAPT